MKFSDTVYIRITRDTMLLAVIATLALVVRLWLFNGLNWDDDPDYVARSWQVLQGQGLIYTDNNGFRIGTYYPAALFYALFGVNNFSCGAYALTVSMAAVVGAYLLGGMLFNSRTGLIAALLLAVYPLDVELASRLMPDGLLAGFSLFAVYFLFRGDVHNSRGPGDVLRARWSYAASGFLLGWCALVNMSAVVLILFFTLYFFLSAGFFIRKCRKSGWARVIWQFVVLRYAILAGAFLVVASVEGLLYYKFTDDFFFKYHNTLSHYAGVHGFNTDLTMYPRIMFHLGRDWTFRFQGLATSYYGFYYIAALAAFGYGLTRRRMEVYAVLLWVLTVFCYLQWGSMSFTEYLPFHRLPRHLSLVTPAMILCLAFFLGNFRPAAVRKWAAPLVTVFLVASSLVFCYYRHQHLTDSVLPQGPVHNYLEFLQPKIVYAANNTVAYQKFLDRFQDRGRRYADIRRAGHNRQEGAYAVIGEFRNWRDVVRDVVPDPARIPVNWELEKTLTVPGRLARAPYRVRVYKLLTEPIPRLELKRRAQMKQFLMKRFPGALRPGSLLMLAWECGRVDGVEELRVRGDRISLRHIAFTPPEDIAASVFRPLPETGGLEYRVIKEQGRGAVTIAQAPSAENGYSLLIRVDDGPFPRHDFYRFFVIADKKKF